jgi:hypothetical protein
MYQFIPTVLNNDDEIGEWLNGSEDRGHLSRAG